MMLFTIYTCIACVVVENILSTLSTPDRKERSTTEWKEIVVIVGGCIFVR
jgi:hypothetical protein